MMTDEEIVKQVKAIIVDKLGVEESEVTESANFTNDLGADSLDTVELLMEFEKVFGIKIPDEETSSIATVKDAIDKVKEKLAQSEAAK
jgi:acyl carrier protein